MYGQGQRQQNILFVTSTKADYPVYLQFVDMEERFEAALLLDQDGKDEILQ